MEMKLGSALVIEARIIGHKEANDTNLSTHSSNLLRNPFNITTLLMIYIEDCRSEYRAKETQAQEIFTLETINLIFFPIKLQGFLGRLQRN